MNYGLCLDSGEFIAADELNSQAEQANRPLDVRDARIAGLEQRNRDLYEDVQRFKEHALSEKDARMVLERELAEARKQMEAQKDEWLSWDAKRSALEKDAERWRFASWHIGLAWGEEGFTSLVRIVSDKHRALINEQVDMLMAGKMPETRAAMQKGHQ